MQPQRNRQAAEGGARSKAESSLGRKKSDNSTANMNVETNGGAPAPLSTSSDAAALNASDVVMAVMKWRHLVNG